MWIILIVSLGLAAVGAAVEPEYLDQLLAEGRDEEFAKLMKIDVSLVRPKEERSEGSIMNMASPLGDILLPPGVEVEEARQGLKFSKYRFSRWPNNQIPYVISNSYSSSQRGVIENAINDFNRQVSRLKLVRRSNQKDYVMVFSGNGCYSYLGRTGDEQALSLQSNGCVYRSTVQHEFMHAAGFTHEQNRPDRDEFVKILFENIPARWQSQYQKVSSDDYGIQGPYDYYSIMHYPVTAPDSGGKPAFEVLRSGIDKNRIGNGETFTGTDVNKINRLYN